MYGLKKTSINGPLWLIGHYSLLLIKQDNKKHLWNFRSRCDSHTYIFLASFFHINKLFICLISCSMAKKRSMITRMISLWKESVTRTHQIIVMWKKKYCSTIHLKNWNKANFFGGQLTTYIAKENISKCGYFKQYWFLMQIFA